MVRYARHPGQSSVVEICNVLLTNALLAVGLAVTIAIACSRIRRPALRHVLWLLVLIRLIIPPIWIVDFTPSFAWLQSAVSRVAVQHAENQMTWRAQYLAARKAVMERTPGLVPLRSIYTAGTGESNEFENAVVGAVKPQAAIGDLLRLAWGWTKSGLFCLWILGIVVCAVYQLIAVWRFRRRIHRDAYRSGIWQRRADKLARRMGLVKAPRVAMVRASISPVLWGLGRHAHILLPDRLMEQLDRRAQDGLIYHELAHYQRGDHWVRLLESLVLVIYWWHPVFWWTRHEITKAEEQCCDLAAIRHTGGDRRTYAEALLQALDFVSATTFLPAASGAVRSGLLRIRIRQIMAKRQERPGGGQFGPGLVLACAAALLPFPWISTADRVGVYSPAPFTTALNPPSTSTSSSPLQPTSTPAATASHVPHREQHAECQLMTDQQHRTQLQTSDRKLIDFGVGRVAESAWSNDRHRIAIGKSDGSVEVYSTVTGDRHFAVHGETSAICALCFSPNGDRLAFANRIGEITLTDAWTGKQQLRIRRRHADTIKVTFESDDLLQLRWSQKSQVFEETLYRVDGKWAL